jgi:hypothetical protein
MLSRNALRTFFGRWLTLLENGTSGLEGLEMKHINWAIQACGWLALMSVIFLACDIAGKPTPVTRTTWTRHGEGRARETENFYLHFDEHPGWGVISCSSSSRQSTDEAKRKAVARAIDTCRIDFGGTSARQIDPPLTHMAIVVNMPGDGEFVGMVFEADDILSDTTPSHALAAKAELHDRPVETVILPGGSSNAPATRRKYLIIEEYEAANGRKIRRGRPMQSDRTRHSK